MIKIQTYAGAYGRINSALILTTAVVITTLFTPVSFAAANNDHCKALTGHKNSADCVFDWGAWELNIEPAAGGIRHTPRQIIKPLDPQFSLTTNSTAALAPTEIPRVVTPPTIAAPPAATPHIPVTPPPAPNVGPSPGSSSISGTGGLNLGF